MASIHHAYPNSIGNDVKQGQHYMLFSSYESLSATAASTKLKSSIAIYIPPNSLTSTIQQNYQEMEGGATRAFVGGKMGMTVDGIKSMFTSDSTLPDDIKALAEGALNKVRPLADFRSAGFGLATNNKVALTYKGPQGFRDHSFTFHFFPKSKGEAIAVLHLIRDFQNGATPIRHGIFSKGANKLIAPFFAAPRQWDIKFIMGKQGGGENPYLPKLKRSVITSFAVNHDPESVISFHQDGSPVHTTLTMTFKEIEFVMSEDKVEARFNDSVDKVVQQKVDMHSKPGQLGGGRVQSLATRQGVTPSSVDAIKHVEEGMAYMNPANRKR